jgi:hypothetical protein
MSFLNCCRANEIKNDFIINNEKSENSKKEMNNSIISSTKKREIVNSQNNSNPIINNTNQNNVILNENQNNINFTQISFGNLDFSTANNSISSGKLLLTGNLFFNKELIITQNGLVNSLRKRIDGQTFFGTSNAKDYTGTFYNDFVLNLPDDDNKNQEILSHTGRIFGISFSKITNDYQIYMMNANYYLNYDITNSFYFQNEKENLIILGKILMTIVQKDNSSRKKILDIKIETEDNEEEEKIYNFEEKDSPISIGRINSSINLNYSFISKKHAVIEFSEEYSKFYYKDLKSTNGSILILKEDDSLKIKGNMKFKLNDINFHILELP